MFFKSLPASFYEDLLALPLEENEQILILAGEKSGLDYATLQSTFQQKEKPFWGGFFPSIIGNNEQSAESILVLKVPTSASPIIVGLKEETPFSEDIEWLAQGNGNTHALMVLVDGLSAEIESFLYRLQSNCPTDLPILGGGAGSLSLKQSPCLFDQHVIGQDVALLIPLTWKVGLGVRHGWKRLAGPLLATETTRTVVKELNWEPAYHLYKKVLATEADTAITEEDFFSVAKGFPFGIYQEGEEDIVVRDPIICLQNGELVCVGEVPENSMLHILEGKHENLIKAAEQATKDSVNQVQGTLQKPFVIDCISRVLFLEDNFSSELAIINQTLQTLSEDAALRGILSLGEISSDRHGALNFYNKTIVTGLFYE